MQNNVCLVLINRLQVGWNRWLYAYNIPINIHACIIVWVAYQIITRIMIYTCSLNIKFFCQRWISYLQIKWKEKRWKPLVKTILDTVEICFKKRTFLAFKLSYSNFNCITISQLGYFINTSLKQKSQKYVYLN